MERPLFNHRDPTTAGDHLYFRRSVERFRLHMQNPAVLFVVEEGGEIEDLFDDLTTAMSRFPYLFLRAVRHRHSDQPADVTTVRATGQHQLWRANVSAVTGGVALEKPEDEKLIIQTILRGTE